MSTVIIGGGIIGLSTAYYLSQSEPAHPIHIIDSSPELLMSASGFAGGFLALDWFAPDVAALGRLSFNLHRELAEKNNGQKKWGYSGSHVYSLAIENVKPTHQGKKKTRDEDWLSQGTSRGELAGIYGTKSNAVDNKQSEPEIRINNDGTPIWMTPQVGGTVETISSPDSCGQVEPRELCEFLLSECQAHGVKIHLSTEASKVLCDNDGVLEGLRLQSTQQETSGTFDLECQNILISAGAWTPRVFKALFPKSQLKIGIDPLAGHSLTVRSPRYTKPFPNSTRKAQGHRSSKDDWLCYAIYSAPCQHFSYSPEAFARLARNGETEIWLGGLNDPTLPLPKLAADVKSMINKASIAELRKTTVQLAGLGKEGEITNQDDLETIREALCFRPVSRTGRPILSKVDDNDTGLKTTGIGGVWIASGHGPWGISLSLGSGKVMSEMLQGRQPSANISSMGLR